MLHKYTHRFRIALLPDVLQIIAGMGTSEKPAKQRTTAANRLNYNNFPTFSLVFYKPFVFL